MSGLDPAAAVTIGAAELSEAVTRLLVAAGFPTEDAAQAADALVAADLRGVTSHGVSNMLGVYVDWVHTGRLNPRPAWRVVRERPGTANVDCDGGLGVAQAPRAMDLAIEKARTTGVAMVTLHNSRHLGMAGYHAMRALPNDMIGVCITAVRGFVAPTFGRAVRLGTNPIAVAAPAGEEPPFVFDAATSTIPGNRVTDSIREGRPLPPGTIADDDGTPIMESIMAPADYHDLLLLPLGATRQMGSHKGYGLACAVDILSGVLSGAGSAGMAMSDDADHMLMAIDVDAFTDVATFKREMDEFLRWLKSTPPAAGQQEVLVAGQQEWEIQRERLACGIPLHPDVVAWFRQACASAGVPLPAAFRAAPVASSGDAPA